MDTSHLGPPSDSPTAEFAEERREDPLRASFMACQGSSRAVLCPGWAQRHSFANSPSASFALRETRRAGYRAIRAGWVSKRGTGQQSRSSRAHPTRVSRFAKLAALDTVQSDPAHPLPPSSWARPGGGADARALPPAMADSALSRVPGGSVKDRSSVLPSPTFAVDVVRHSSAAVRSRAET